MTLKKGQKVSYTFYGNLETATIERVANGIVWLDNGRWMHETSVKPVKAGRSKAAKAKKTLTKDQMFFYEHAGYSYNSAKGETAEQGRVRCAIELAQAEQYAANLEWTYEWDWDESGCNGCDCKSADCACYTGAGHETLVALLKDQDGRVLASLSGICGVTDSYRRTVEAELASEAMVDFDKEIETIDAH
jgi:hypothetical protein